MLATFVGSSARLLGGGVPCQPPRSGPQQSGWGWAPDATFNPFFNESDADRAELERVEIDAADERRIGDADLDAHLAMLRGKRVRVTNRGKDVDYLSGLVEAIRPQMMHADRYPTIRVYFADTPDVDARAFPGGSIVVTAGMMDLARNEAALVGVLGHELSHIDHGHQLRMARAAKFAEGGWDYRQGGHQEMQRRIMMMSRNFAKPFSADDEAAADRDGATWAFALGYEPFELAKLFSRMDRRQPQRPGGMPSFLLTHPYNADRYEAVQELAANLQADRPNAQPYIGTANLEKRVPRSVRQFAE